MDVFDLQSHVVSSYENYVKSFYQFRDQQISDFVNKELGDGRLWPHPLIQLNPAYAPGVKMHDLFLEGVLTERCGEIFKGVSPYKHQEEAIRAAREGKNYVLTTGTGSGKSLSYIIPIVDHVLREGPGKGIRAVIVYPMNALANSQMGELEKFLGKDRPQVSFKRYTGQETLEEKQAIRNNPPDILLTNYVMLELIFSRSDDNLLVNKMRHSLRFLVLDELHTYRGRQGADVAMLVRRVRCMLDFRSIQMVGTSATMGGGSTWAEKQKRVAAVASKLFGQQVEPGSVIGETLVRITQWCEDEPGLYQALADRVRSRRAPLDYEAFIKDPLAAWIESTIGIRKEESSGRWVRSMPMSIFSRAGADEKEERKGCAQKLAELTDCDVGLCAEAIRETLLTGNKIINPYSVPPRPVFAFRLHQFISRGETVYASLQEPKERKLTLNGQLYATADKQVALLPLAFCRNCGQEYYVVNRSEKDGEVTYKARNLSELDRDTKPGYLYYSLDHPWPDDETEEFKERLPDELYMTSMRKYWPARAFVGLDGKEQSDGAACSYISAPLRFCLHCGISYTSNNSEYAQLTQLASDGRSTATTILSLASVSWLRGQGGADIEQKARKILSFTDNRQDASLQAGHFNDFVSIGLMRAALYKAVSQAPEEGLRYDDLANKTLAALGLDIQDFAVEGPNYALPPVRRSAENALRKVLAYQIITDLRRGWRVNMPNLENCGLVEIIYDGLEDICQMDSFWEDTHPKLKDAPQEGRKYLLKTLMDHLRKELCIDCAELDPENHNGLKAQSRTHLKSPWALDDREQLRWAGWAWTRSKYPQEEGGRFVTWRSAFGKFLGRAKLEGGWALNTASEPMTREDKTAIIGDLFKKLVEAGLLKAENRGPAGWCYQIPATVLLFQKRDAVKRDIDPLYNPSAGTVDSRPNSFFCDFYRGGALNIKQMEAREHTAQVSPFDRQERERLFREGKLPVMFCSPTMELGVDISDLNVVGMRNVPPTPANYAQRSGRAGRSGQPALVVAYCSTGSAHDQYFFRRMEQMVAGEVATPQLELANEDLLRSHLHAIWLFETGMKLGEHMGQVVDVTQGSVEYKLAQTIRDAFNDAYAQKNARKRILDFIWQMRRNRDDVPFATDSWVEAVISGVQGNFDESCNRWREMVKAAIDQMNKQNNILQDMARTQDHAQAGDLYRLASNAFTMLTTRGENDQSDFYPYRYFASEGFLPGYNFPRLPITALIGRAAQGAHQASLQRPRFLAISEFGPHSVIYHEGAHYKVVRVMLPIDPGSDSIPTQTIKICAKCGHLNPKENEVCAMCSESLKGCNLSNLFKMQTVAAQRKSRITADEENRQSKGYELRTVVRFAQGATSVQKIEALSGGEVFMRMAYGATATIWRINIGLRKRKNQNEKGYVIDAENGRWVREKDQIEREGPEEEDSERVNRQQTVIPFVEDRRNCLLVNFENPLSLVQMASLQAAFKTAIQAEYQLEDSELAAEPLPNMNERNYLLFYEAAEGGAGVLRQLVSDPLAVNRLAERALEICHFAKDGSDLLHAEGGNEDCMAACYDCLMSYTNQLDHERLDRHEIVGILLTLKDAQVNVSPTDVSREDHYHHLLGQCQTKLEKDWLTWVQEHKLRLPTHAQFLIAEANTIPDFVYEAGGVRYAVFIDGPVHERISQTESDTKTDSRLLAKGVIPIRFAQRQGWAEKANEHASVFGPVKDGGRAYDL